MTDGYGGSLGGNAQGKYSNFESISSRNDGVSNEYYSSSLGGLDQQGVRRASFVNGGVHNSNSFVQQSNYPTDAHGLYQDPNPEVVRRPAVGGLQTYTQRVSVRFLQPPPLPPPGVSISTNN